MSADAVLQRVKELELPGYGDDEVTFMAEAMAELRPSDVFEWGTNVGSSARIFYEASRALGFPCEVHTFELPMLLAVLDRDHPGHRHGEHSGGFDRIFHHYGDGLYSSLLLYARTKPARALFFLDGCHKHGVVLHELESISVVAPGAVMLVHDTADLTGRAVDEFLEYGEIGYNRYRREGLNSQAGMARLWPI